MTTIKSITVNVKKIENSYADEIASFELSANNSTTVFVLNSSGNFNHDGSFQFPHYLSGKPPF